MMLNASSLEESLLKPLDLLERYPMSREKTEILVKFNFATKEAIAKIAEDFNNAMIVPVPKILRERVDNCLTVDIDDKVLVFIAALTEGNIGQSIIYVYYIQYWAKKMNRRLVTFHNFCIDIFPLSFFDMDEVRTLWYDQKYNGGNMIDNPKYCESIMF